MKYLLLLLTISSYAQEMSKFEEQQIELMQAQMILNAADNFTRTMGEASDRRNAERERRLEVLRERSQPNMCITNPGGFTYCN